jgi:folate-binding protein YgfZ
VTDAFNIEDQSILRISGADRYTFLQGQLTQDVDSLTPRNSALTGWTTAKGRLLLVGQLMTWNDAIYLPVATDVANQVAERLSLFVLRADVQIDVPPELNLMGLSAGAADPATVDGLEVPAEPGACRSSDTLCVARVVGDPTRLWVIGTPEETAAIRATTNSLLSAGEWTLRNIRAGIPEIQQTTSEAFVPQMLNLDLLGGVSFVKGCYVGQEIVARTQNLGRIKRRMYRFRAESEHSFTSGELIYGPDKATGKIVSCSHDGRATELLAVIAIDSAGGQWFTNEDLTLPVERQPLPYLITETD